MKKFDSSGQHRPGFTAFLSGVLTILAGLSAAPEAMAREDIRLTVTGHAPSCSGVRIGNDMDGYICVDASSFYGGGGGYRGSFDAGGSGSGGTTDTSVGRDTQAQSTAPVVCPVNQSGAPAATGSMITAKPVMIATGTKVLPELDFVVPPDTFPLKVSRLYNKNLTRAGIFGPRWSSNLDINLTFEYGPVQCTGSLSSASACNTGGNALSKIYANGETGYGTPFTLIGSVWTSSDGDTITPTGSNWLYTTELGVNTTFDAYGRPLTVRDERGVGLTYAYDSNNQLATVAHSSGRSISFYWSGTKVVSIVAPNGSAYGYGYSASGHLASVAYPGNLGTRTYHYEDSAQPGGLTGISINGTRYSRYSYLADGKVYQSGLEGGIERSTFVYGANFTEVTNALGHKVHYEYADIGGKRRLIWVDSTGTLSCSGSVVFTTYDGNGNKDVETDHYGVTTDYNFDSDNRITQKISGIGSAGQTDQQQVTQYVWDPVRKGRLNQVKVFGASTSQPLSSTTYTYYPDGSTLARLLQSIAVTNFGGGTVGTLTTNYSYTVYPSGLVATITEDGPLSGRATTQLPRPTTAREICSPSPIA